MSRKQNIADACARALPTVEASKESRKRRRGPQLGSGKWSKKNECGFSCDDWIFLSVTRIMREDQVGQREACRRLFKQLLMDNPRIEVSKKGQNKERSFEGKIRTGGDQLYTRYQVALKAFEARDARPISELFSAPFQSHDVVRN